MLNNLDDYVNKDISLNFNSFPSIWYRGYLKKLENGEYYLKNNDIKSFKKEDVKNIREIKGRF